MIHSKQVMTTVTYRQCDFCVNADNNGQWIDHCVKCNKDFCNDCVGDAVEDGGICKECGELYRFETEDDPDYEWGCVSLIDKSTLENVYMPYI